MAPPATAGYSVADDLATRQVVVFGGIADNQATWLWSGSRWSLAQPATSPSGRIEAAAAYDPALHLVLLFGGHGPRVPTSVIRGPGAARAGVNSTRAP